MGMANMIFSSNRMTTAWSALVPFCAQGQIANCVGEALFCMHPISVLQFCIAHCCMLPHLFQWNWNCLSI